MEFRKLGNSDLHVSVVAMGCWAIVGDSTWGNQEESDSLATIRAALDAGINFFDTAEAYGDGLSERLLGKALAGRRGEAVIASKYGFQRESVTAIRAACERSLQNLASDYIDLYQIHWASRTIPPVEAIATLDALKAEGKIRAYGVCNYGPGDLSEIPASASVATNQLPYSLLWRAIEFEIQPACAKRGIGILPYSPLAQGLLTGKFKSADDVPEGRARTRHFSKQRVQTRHGEGGEEAETFAAIARIAAISQEIGQPMSDVSLAWLLRQEGVVSVLAGMRTPQQVAENIRGASLQLDDRVIADLGRATDELKRRLGANADMWQSESRYR